MRRLARSVLFACVLVASFTAAFAEVVARKAEPTQGDVEIGSPMLLDVPFPAFLPEAWDGRSTIVVPENLRRYSCDGVSIVTVYGTASKPKKGFVRIAMSVRLMNRPGHDKLVDILLQPVDGDRNLGNGIYSGGIDVEEGRSAERRVHLVIPEADLRSASSPKLRIKLTAKDH